ncbi:MAG: ABC transporter ATP-binding protein/permease [Oscillospiraceae bacterium]|nr:ABC transporter ATP-binding protein/permease [Oscillospiraceae bacterium]
MSENDNNSNSNANTHNKQYGRLKVVTEKPQNMWGTIKRLLKYMQKYKFLIFLSFIIAIVGGGIQVFIPKILGSATNIIFDGIKNSSGVDFSKLGTTLIYIVALYVGMFITSFVCQRLMVVVSQKTTYNIRNELKAKMNKVPVSYFDKNSNGKLMSVAINDMDNIVTNLEQSLTDLIISVILIIGIFAIMMFISPILTLIVCITIPGSYAVMKIITPQTKENGTKYFNSLGSLNGQIEETYKGFLVLKSFNGEKEAIDKFSEINDDMYKTGWKTRFFGGLTMPSMGTVRNIVYVLVAIVGGIKVVSGTISIGDVQAFLQYSNQFSQPLTRITQIWSNVINMIVSCERVFAMLDEEEMGKYEEKFTNKLEETEKVVFEHVKFSYTDEPLIKNFSTRVECGKMIAIVGHTGAGKTTITNLIERFYEIKDGSIRIDGKDIRNMPRSELREKIGIVSQDAWVFAGTIYENIRYGNENATKEQIYSAAKAAYADEFIQKLPDGYNTMLNEDAGNISQGQRQLITIARAFVSNPDILILDEATSNVDSRTELIIQKATKKLLNGRTSFVVAHRLSTIYDADCILVMADGDVVETGTHKELLENNGVYADIYNSQFANGVSA